MVHERIDRDQENQMIARVPLGAIFAHYKGGKYKILGVGRDSEILGLCVIYQALYDSSDFGDHAVWIRPLEMFFERVAFNGKEIARFELISGDVR
jgi:hypothetical protein